jgi:transposase
VARKANRDKRIELRLHALELRASGLKNPEIAQRLWVNPKVVSRWVSRYCNHGLTSIIKLKYGGNRRNLSNEQEKVFLEKYETEASKGHVIVVSEMKKEYDELVGHKTGSGTIYKMMKRHEWRKVMPRAAHPKKASEEEIALAKNKT